MEMGKKSTPWLDLVGERYKGNDWFMRQCLKQHYVIPSEASQVRFHKGQHPEALHHVPADGAYHEITGHHNSNLDDFRTMLDDFAEWFGRKPSWIWVEWR